MLDTCDADQEVKRSTNFSTINFMYFILDFHVVHFQIILLLLITGLSNVAFVRKCLAASRTRNSNLASMKQYWRRSKTASEAA